mmetsp:Transcript_10465/g.31974  ORF Transcript_10465/g.31974 Transcript_10465/m.31974 type:complete len:512 (+) Transcript_10465:88-1623(+)
MSRSFLSLRDGGREASQRQEFSFSSRRTSISAARGVDWNETQMIVKLPAKCEAEDADEFLETTVEKLMMYDDRAHVSLGDVIVLVIGVWFPRKYSSADMLNSVRNLDGILVTMEGRNSDSSGHPMRTSILKTWTESKADKEKLDIVSMGSWMVIPTERERTEKGLVARTVTVHFKSRFASSLRSDRHLVVAIRETVEDWLDNGLDDMLDEYAKAPTSVSLSNRTVAKALQVRVPAVFHTHYVAISGRSLVSVSVENVSKDVSVAVMPPVIHASSSMAEYKLEGTAPKPLSLEDQQNTNLYAFKPLGEIQTEPKDLSLRLDWEDIDEFMHGSPTTYLGPGEIFEFVYSVESRPDAVPLQRDVMYRSPVTIAWTTFTSEEDKRDCLDRRRMNTSIVEMNWRSAEVLSDITISFSGPKTVEVAKRFNVKVIAWNHGKKELEAGVLRIRRGSLLPLRSSIALGRVSAGGSVAVVLPCVAFNRGIASLHAVCVIDSSNAWSAERPFEVFVDAPDTQ